MCKKSCKLTVWTKLRVTSNYSKMDKYDNWTIGGQN